MTWIQFLAPFICFGPLYLMLWWVARQKKKDRERPLPEGWVRNPDGTETYHRVIKPTHVWQDGVLRPLSE